MPPMDELLALLLLSTCIVACGSDPADFEGDYSINITNRENGCEFDDWQEGNTASNIGVVVTQDGDQVTATVEGVTGAFLGLVLGDNVFEANLADVVNRLLQNLVLRCAKEDGVRDYFYVGVVGYGDRVQPLVRPAEEVALYEDLVAVSHLAERPLRLEQRRDGDVEAHLRAEARQRPGRALPPLAEAEILARHNTVEPEPHAQHLAREHLRDPYFTLTAARELDAMDRVDVPPQYARAFPRS